MSNIETIMDRFDDVIDLCIYLWPVSALAVTNMLAATFFVFRTSGDCNRRMVIFAYALFSIPAAMLIPASILDDSGPQLLIFCLLVGVQCLSTGWLLVAGKGTRWPIGSISSCHILLSIGVWIVAILANATNGV